MGATLPSGQVACVPDEIREIIYCVIGCDCVPVYLVLCMAVDLVVCVALYLVCVCVFLCVCEFMYFFVCMFVHVVVITCGQVAGQSSRGQRRAEGQHRPGEFHEIP